MRLSKANTSSRLDLCPEFMEILVGQALFTLHRSQKLQQNLEGISVKNSQLR